MPAAQPLITLANARVTTMDPRLPEASVVQIRGGRIVGVGPAALAQAPADRTVDLGGRRLLPGFIDAHNHLSISALFPRWADLRGVQDAERLGESLRRQAAAEPDAPWIRGAGWTGRPAVDRDMLDALGLDRPILVANVSLHDGVVDSRGLDALGVGEHVADPPTGHYERDARGRLTGRVFEQAYGPAHAASLDGVDDTQGYQDAIAARARLFLREGITCVHDAACSPRAEAAYRAMADAGTLPISVLTMPHARAMFTDNPGRRREGPRTGEGDEWLRVGPVKFFADGGNAPAMSAAPGGPHTGLLNAALGEQVRETVRQGYRVAVHAVGDVALQATLDAFTGAARARKDDDHRFRVEHGFITHPAQIAAMASLGAVASVQPGVEALMGPYLGMFGEHIRTRAFRYAELAEAGIPMAASSDDPCTPYGPLFNALPASIRRTAAPGRLAAAAGALAARLHRGRRLRGRAGGRARQHHRGQAGRPGGA